MAFQRIDDNFDKMVNSVLGSLEPVFPLKNKKQVYEVGVAFFLIQWEKIKKEKDDLKKARMLSDYTKKVLSIKQILENNNLMPVRKGVKKDE